MRHRSAHQHLRKDAMAALATLAALAAMAGLVLLLVAVPVSAAEPGTSPPVVTPGDPRSEGEGPGLSGEPIIAAVAVVILGVAAAGGTLLVLRLTRDD